MQTYFFNVQNINYDYTDCYYDAVHTTVNVNQTDVLTSPSHWIYAAL